MKLSPKISIIVPSFNKGKYIKKTLESVFFQDYPNFEVIVQDGGSTDQTIKILKTFAEKYKSLKWVSKKDKGQLDAINKGLKKAKGEILTYINADDMYFKGAFKKVADSYQKSPESLWFAGKGIVVDKDGNKSRSFFYRIFVELYKNILLGINKYPLLLMVNYLMQPSVFLSKRAFKDYGPFTGTKSFVMEYELWLRIGKEEMPRVVNKYLSKFRLDGENKSSTEFKEIMREDYQIVSKFTKNIILLFIHKINNIGRIVLVRVMNSCKGYCKKSL